MRSPNATAGKLRDVIAWQSPVRTASATGQTVVTWVDEGDQRCHVEAVAGTERLNADQPLPQHSHRVTVRARTKDIAHDWRGLWVDRNGTTRTLNAVVILPADTGDDWQVVLCQEQAPTTEA
jgi:head-tail adaptor